MIEEREDEPRGIQVERDRPNLVLEEVHAACATAGEAVTEPGGSSRISVKCRNVGPQAKIVISGLELETTYRGPECLRAVIPPQLLKRSGSYPVAVIEGRRISNVVELRVDGEEWPEPPTDQSDSDSPLVSIVIPAYNQASLLAEAIASAMGQGHRPLGVIVVDDGSTDDTRDVVARWGSVRYIHQRNQGVAAARNRGFRESRGDYVIFLDHDDRLLSNAVESGIRELETAPGAALAAGRSIITGSGPAYLSPRLPRSENAYREMLVSNSIFCPAQVVFRAESLRAVDGFCDSTSLSEDYDLYLRVMRRFTVVLHNRLVVEYRKHDGNVSIDRILMFERAMKTLIRHQAYLWNDPGSWNAYLKGRRWKRDDFRAEIVRGAITARCARDRKALWRVVPLIIRYFPWDVASIWGRVRTSNHLLFTVGEQSREVGDQRASPGKTPLVADKLFPTFISQGQPFNVQPDGSSAIALECRGAREGAVIFFDGKPLETAFDGQSLLTAVVPPEMVATVGGYEVYVRSL